MTGCHLVPSATGINEMDQSLLSSPFSVNERQFCYYGPVVFRYRFYIVNLTARYFYFFVFFLSFFFTHPF